MSPDAVQGYFTYQDQLAEDLGPGDAYDAFGALRLGLANGGAFIRTDTTLLLRDGEDAVYEVAVALLTEVKDREFRGGSQGVSVPLGHGVRYRAGAVRGRLVTIGTHWETADEGRLTVTTQQVVYHGRRKTLAFPFAKLATLKVYSDGIGLGVTSRQSTSSFSLGNPEVVAGIIAAAFDRRDKSTILNLVEIGDGNTFDVILTDAGDKKIQVIKIVRAATGLRLREAKALVDRAPTAVKRGIDKAEADRLKADIKDAGGTVELKALDGASQLTPAPPAGRDTSYDQPAAESSSTLVSGPASRQPPGVTSSAPGAAIVGPQWAKVLRDRAIPPRGELLASHPRAAEWTEIILRGLTVERLVLMANVQHNYCGPKDLRPHAAPDRSRDADLAWQALLDGMRTPRTRPSGWTGAVKLLTDGAEPALEYVSTLTIGPLIAVCACIVDGPYLEANRRGIR